MADAILYGLATEILKKLGADALSEITVVCGVKDDLRKLEKTITTIKAVLLDAEKQQQTNNQVRDWLEKIEDAFLDADDLLDEFSTELLGRQVMTRNKKAKKVHIFFSRSNQFAFNFKMSHKIKAIRGRLDAIAADRNNFQFTVKLVESPAQMIGKREETHSFVFAEEVIGRDGDKKKVIDLLLFDYSDDVQENVSVVSIVGIGGLGKTTLAQLVYNDDQVKSHFDLKMWVCVSDPFNVKTIAENIIRSASGDEVKNLQMDQVQARLREKIDRKKYLLVLDDVWNEDREKWLRLKYLLMGGARGSKILLTTRAQLVATVVDSISSYRLEGLTENESWSLFKMMAFKEGIEPENPRVVAIAKEITKKCKGVPLALRSLGSLLYDKDTEAEWLAFKDIDLAKIAQKEDIIVPILKLSYDFLPSHLKRCFAYCCLYPKDSHIWKETLIRLWIAQGYVQLIDENQNLEDVGESYFMDLLRRSFFQDVLKDEFGNIYSCKMHDLIHDVAQSVAGTGSVLANLDTINVTERTRHASFDSIDFTSPGAVLTPLMRAKKIRTLFLPNNLLETTCNKIISSFQRLRVLDLQMSRMHVVANCIGQLKHLRYLDLSSNNIMNLPSSITQLWNLQTLDLTLCQALEELPTGIEKMVSLRHLDLEYCFSLDHLPRGIGQLTSLRTLSWFVVGKNSSPSGGINELIGLNNLRGMLEIYGLDRLRNTMEEVVKDANYLKGKEYLQSLSLIWGNYYRSEHSGEDDGEANVVDELVLEALQPHPNLKSLEIRGYTGMSFPSWMMQHNTTLQSLTIARCINLTSLPEGMRRLTALQKLIIVDCPELEERCRRETGEDWPNIAHIPEVKIF